MASALSRVPAFVACGRVLGPVLLAWLALTSASWAQGLPPVPELTAHVMDLTGTLSTGQRQALETRLTAFEQERGAQFVLLLVPTTQPGGIASYTRRVGDAWQIGRNDEGDGLLLVMARDEHLVRIAATPALEELVPERSAKRIIEQDIMPRFSQGNIAGALEAGADRLMALVSDDTFMLPEADPNGLAGWDIRWLDVAVFLLLTVPIAARLLSAQFGRKRAAMVVGIVDGMLIGYLGASVLLGAAAAVAAALFALLASLDALEGMLNIRAGPSTSSSLGLGGGNWRAGSGSSSNSGGFSSGGGGDFGGGGASGSW